MEIQLSPPTELIQTSPGVPGAEEPHKSKPEKNSIGVFAKILAGLSDRGLLRKTGTGETALGGIPGAEISDAVPLAETTETGEAGPLSGGKGKNSRIGKTAAAEKTDTKKLSKTGKTEPESPQPEPAEHEKALFALGRLTGQAENQPVLGKTEGDGESLTADLRHYSRESVKTETLSAELIEHEGHNQPFIAHSAALAVEEPAENPQTVGEKAKNRLNSATAAAKNRSSTAEIPVGTAGEYQQAGAQKTVSVEKEGRGKLEEARNKRRGVNVEVRDFRTGEAVSDGAAKNGGVPLRVGAEVRMPGESAVKDIVLELRLPDQGREAATATTTWEAKAGQAFEDLLARELHQNFNNDIVRHASVALRDGNEGTIRLALKPESLGNVKIRLEMAENRITGQIIVESKEALRAFEREISSLEKAFRDSGFEGANLEMSLAADGRGAEQQWQETEASQFLPGLIAASRYDTALEWMEIPLTLDVYQQGARAVNMFA
ncbi:MAG: flagellar hook-length control protein FliK [Treponema sp.]|nr:flagellar hook-length control protein FliK [Treponema sp.]